VGVKKPPLSGQDHSERKNYHPQQALRQ